MNRKVGQHDAILVWYVYYSLAVFSILTFDQKSQLREKKNFKRDDKW